jgi:hypothetical protein
MTTHEVEHQYAALVAASAGIGEVLGKRATATILVDGSAMPMRRGVSKNGKRSAVDGVVSACAALQRAGQV